MASIVAEVKASVFDEEQLRSWHDRTARGPADRPLLQPDPPYRGFRDLTKEEAKAVDAEHLRRLHGGHPRPVAAAA
jgi:hypothetical protein